MASRLAVDATTLSLESLQKLLGWRRRIPLKQQAAFTRKFAALLKSGLPIHEALSLASIEAGEAGKLQASVAAVRNHIRGGDTLAQAMSKQPDVFDNLYVSMIYAGEESGRLVAVLERVASYLESQTAWRNKLTSALAYPTIMLVLSLLAVGILYAVFIPEIVKIFQQSGRPLPLPTRALATIGDVISSLGLLWIPLLVLTYLQIAKLLQTPRGQEISDRAFLKIPIFGGIYRDQIVSRVSRTLATLLASGIALSEALQIAAKVANNKVYLKQMQELDDSLKAGGDLATPLSKSPLFSPSFASMVATGERTGDLPEMLEQAANAYDREIEYKLNVIARASEPLLMVATAAMVLFIALSVLLPMFRS